MKSTDHNYKGLKICARLSALLLLICAIGCRKASQDEAGANAPKDDPEAVAVRAVPAELRSIAQEVQGLGRCEPLLDQVATLTPSIEGKVRAILVKEGDVVAAGAPIVQLDTGLAQRILAEKKADRDAQRASLRLLESLPRPAEQQSYQLAIDSARSAVEKAQALVEGLRPLQQRGEISALQMRDAETALKQAQLQQQTAEAQFKVAMLGPRPQAVEEAKAKIATADAAVASAQTQLDLLTIRSPIAGVVDSLSCRLGDTLAAGTAIGQVVNEERVYVEVWLPPADARRVRAGQTAVITSSTLKKPAAGETKTAGSAMAGRVVFVGSVVDAQTGNLPVRILVDNPTRRLALGQTVAATITVSEKADVLAVPSKAVEDLGEGPVLNVIRQGKSAALHPVLGAKDREWVEVKETDLKPGELVIVEGGYNLPPDTPVAVQPAAGGEKEAAASDKEPERGAREAEKGAKEVEKSGKGAAEPQAEKKP